MPKRNTLAVVPYAPKTEYDRYSRTHQVKPGFLVLEYTSGKAGTQVNANYSSIPIDWRPNVPFKATLTLKRMETGRSAVRFWWHDEATDTDYPMFGDAIVETLKIQNATGGKVTGEWIVVKKGANYGIELYEN